MDYRLELKVRNNNILKKIEEKGYKSVHRLCKSHKKTKWESVIGAFINLKKSPLDNNGELHPSVKWLCKILKCNLYDLFTDRQIKSSLENNKKIMEVKEAEMFFAFSHVEAPLLPDEVLEQKENHHLLTQVLKTLDRRYADIISKLYGLDDGNSKTLGEVAEIFGISRQRVRQIEANALHQLRHPLRKKILLKEEES